MKAHGIGVGYRYPQEFEGADVDQQYLPDELVDRRYYLPTDQGYESTISERIARRAAARATAKETGRTPRSSFAAPSVPRGTGDRVMKGREENRKKLAETEKKIFFERRDYDYALGLSGTDASLIVVANNRSFYNDERLHEELGDVPAAEYEQNFDEQDRRFAPGEPGRPPLTGGALASLVVHELPDDELARYRPAIEAVTADAVQKAARDHIRPDAMAIVLVGDADAFGADLEAANLGRLVIERDTGPQVEGRDEGVQEALGPVDEGPGGPTEGSEEPQPAVTAEPAQVDDPGERGGA